MRRGVTGGADTGRRQRVQQIVSIIDAGVCRNAQITIVHDQRGAGETIRQFPFEAHDREHGFTVATNLASIAAR
jgi:hypothetical protein